MAVPPTARLPLFFQPSVLLEMRTSAVGGLAGSSGVALPMIACTLRRPPVVLRFSFPSFSMLTDGTVGEVAAAVRLPPLKSTVPSRTMSLSTVCGPLRSTA